MSLSKIPSVQVRRKGFIDQLEVVVLVTRDSKWLGRTVLFDGTKLAVRSLMLISGFGNKTTVSSIQQGRKRRKSGLSICPPARPPALSPLLYQKLSLTTPM